VEDEAGKSWVVALEQAHCILPSTVNERVDSFDHRVQAGGGQCSGGAEFMQSIRDSSPDSSDAMLLLSLPAQGVGGSPLDEVPPSTPLLMPPASIF
jgi:hypothetical protein